MLAPIEQGPTEIGVVRKSLKQKLKGIAEQLKIEHMKNGNNESGWLLIYLEREKPDKLGQGWLVQPARG